MTTGTLGGVTHVLKRCLELDVEERERFLEEVKQNDLSAYEEAQSLLCTGKSSLVENEIFLSGLLQIAEAPKRGKIHKKDASKFQPKEIGKYVLLQELGRGGMAEVFRGKTRGVLGFERSVAIKKILSEHTENDSFREMFEFEAHLSALLQHPSIVQVFDFFYHKNNFYLVMEYVHGKNLLEILTKLNEQKLVLPLDCTLLVLIDILKGLEYAHSKADERTGQKLNIVHRDICPRNIMVSYNGNVKIVDFGIAKAMNRTDITDTGSFRGTVSYMAPELLDGMEPDRRTDVFATGLVFYELLTGQTLFKSGSIASTLEKIRRCEIAPKLEGLKLDIKISAMLLKALEKDREKRYASAEDFRLDLQHYLYEQFPKVSDKKLGYVLKSFFSEEIDKEVKAIQVAEKQIEVIREEKAQAGNTLVKSSDWKWIASIAGLTMALLVWLYGRNSKDKGMTAHVDEKPVVSKVEEKVEPSPPPKVQPPDPIVEKAKITERQPAAPVAKKRDVSSLGSCTTLIKSKPPKASVTVNGENIGTTPLIIGLACDKPLKLKLDLEGFQSLEHDIRVKKAGSGVSLSLKAK